MVLSNDLSPIGIALSEKSLYVSEIKDNEYYIIQSYLPNGSNGLLGGSQFTVLNHVFKHVTVYII